MGVAVRVGGRVCVIVGVRVTVEVGVVVRVDEGVAAAEGDAVTLRSGGAVGIGVSVGAAVGVAAGAQAASRARDVIANKVSFICRYLRGDFFCRGIRANKNTCRWCAFRVPSSRCSVCDGFCVRTTSEQLCLNYSLGCPWRKANFHFQYNATRSASQNICRRENPIALFTPDEQFA